jgi:hypothetical protein
LLGKAGVMGKVMVQGKTQAPQTRIQDKAGK